MLVHRTLFLYTLSLTTYANFVNANKNLAGDSLRGKKYKGGDA